MKEHKSFENRIYTIKVDENLDQKLKDFQQQLNEGEEIIGSVVAGDNLVITTKESSGRKIKNLLLEEFRKSNK